MSFYVRCCSGEEKCFKLLFWGSGVQHYFLEYKILDAMDKILAFGCCYKFSVCFSRKKRQ